MRHPHCAYPPPHTDDMRSRPTIYAPCGILTAHIPDLSPATLRVHPSLHPKGPRNSLGPGALARNEERLTDRQMTIIRQILVASIQEVFFGCCPARHSREWKFSQRGYCIQNPRHGADQESIRSNQDIRTYAGGLKRQDNHGNHHDCIA